MSIDSQITLVLTDSAISRAVETGSNVITDDSGIIGSPNGVLSMTEKAHPIPKHLGHTEITMFAITGGKGFHMTFANGWTVSVQWGPGNYCDHHMSIAKVEPDYFTKDHGPSKTAEVAIWHGQHAVGNMSEPEGYQTPEEVAAIITEVSQRPTTEN